MLPVQVVVDRNRRGLALVVDLYGLPFLDGDRIARVVLRAVILRRQPEVSEHCFLKSTAEKKISKIHFGHSF